MPDANIRRNGLYWIVDMTPRGNEWRLHIVDDQGNTRVVDTFRAERYGVGVTYLDGWDEARLRPQLADLDDDSLSRLYRGFISNLASGFPVWQAIGIAIIFGCYWLSANGARVLNEKWSKETWIAALLTAAGVLIAGAVPGAILNGIIEEGQPLLTHIDARRLQNGTYLPIQADLYDLPGTFWYSLWSFVYLIGFLFGGGFVLVWLLRQSRLLAAGAHYVFVPHPAERPIREAQERGWATSPIDAEAVASALDRTPGPEARRMPPGFVSRSHTARAADLTERLKKETELANAVAARERARADAEFWRQQPHQSSKRVQEAERKIDRLEREIAELRQRLDER